MTYVHNTVINFGQLSSRANVNCSSASEVMWRVNTLTISNFFVLMMSLTLLIIDQLLIIQYLFKYERMLCFITILAIVVDNILSFERAYLKNVRYHIL